MPFKGVKERFTDANRKLVGLHFNSSQINLINTIPKKLQINVIRMLIKAKYNVMVFSSNNEYKTMEKIKSKFGQVAVDNINEMVKIKLKRKILNHEI
jgi:hypothetical protein